MSKGQTMASEGITPGGLDFGERERGGGGRDCTMNMKKA